MERSNKANQRLLRRPAHGHRPGTVSIVTLFAILGLLILVGFVGNAGHAVTRKIEAQNAADAAAISSAQWMARGMNAITATNHLLGEVTAIVTIHEALGGPELDAGIEAATPESDMFDTAISNLKMFAPIRGLPVYVPPNVSQIDQQLTGFVVDNVAPGNSTHRVFATIYDSRMTLKRELAKNLVRKGLANLGLFVPPPWGYATAAGAYGVHLHATAEITKITKEWFILRALEEVAIYTKDVKVSLLEEQLIPALAEHAKLIAGVSDDSTTSDVTDVAGRGMFGSSIQSALKRLEEQTPFELTTFPRPFVLKLPVQAEPKPSLQPGPDLPAWGGSANDGDPPDIDLARILRDSARRKRKIRRRLSQLQREIAELNEQQDTVDELLENVQSDSAAEDALEKEKAEIESLRDAKELKLAETRRDLSKLNEEEQNLVANFQEFQSLQNSLGGNLSENTNHLPKQFLNQEQERSTQWVRATYPYVDALRASILAQFEEHLEKSKAKQHFTKWTDRYSLVKAWQFRSGYRFAKTSATSGAWSKSNEFEPLQMYVMRDTYDRFGNERKGREPWTQSSDDGKKAAEKLFTIVGLAHRDFEPLFSPQVYPSANDLGITAYAQAIIYNANPQTRWLPGTDDTRQPQVGWDTLNWAPNTSPPEWGADPAIGKARWPWEIFSTAEQADVAKVKLNWQAKLMPATRTRIAEAAVDHVADDLGTVLGLSALNFSEMNSH